jgi:tRNA-intron lyase
MDSIKQDLEEKGWVVRDGLLYGADFVLYKPTAQHSHSEYLVMCIKGTVTYRQIMGLLRCARSVKKVKNS